MASINGVMYQTFHWYSTNDGTFWQHLTQQAPQLAAAGFTAPVSYTHLTLPTKA